MIKHHLYQAHNVTVSCYYAQGDLGERTAAPGGNLLMGLFFALSDHFHLLWSLGSVNLHSSRLVFAVILFVTTLIDPDPSASCPRKHSSGGYFANISVVSLQ